MKTPEQDLAEKLHLYRQTPDWTLSGESQFLNQLQSSMIRHLTLIDGHEVALAKDRVKRFFDAVVQSLKSLHDAHDDWPKHVRPSKVS